MRFLALGPLVLSNDGVVARPGRPREQIVLATLLLDAGYTVPIDELVDVVWAESPPPSARTQIAISISMLRRRFESAGIAAETLVTDSHGYQLHTAERDIDIEVFHRDTASALAAKAEGRLADASAGLHAALGLWRGRAFGSIHNTFVEAAAARLDDQRVTALEQYLALELELGRHQQLIGELRKLADEHPHRERPVELLMVALYRCGRQVEALDVYRATRESLAEELGLEPGERLRHLEQAILIQDETLAVPDALPQQASVPVPRQLPPDIPDITGREADAAVIEDWCMGQSSRSDGVVPVFLITGAGGTGKTTLAVHAAHRLRQHYPDGQLYADLRGFEPASVDPAEVLARFLRALGCMGASIPDSVEERAALYRSLLADSRTLIVLDNAGSEQQMEPLLPGSASCRVIVTSRLALSPPGTQRLDMGPLPLEASVELLARTAGRERVSAEPSVAAKLVSLCGGLPLALRIIGSRLAARPHWQLADLAARLEDERKRLDELNHGALQVRASLAMSWHGLDQRARTLARRLGWLGVSGTPAWVGAALLEVDVAEAEDVLGSLVEARLLDVGQWDAAGRARYSFHELVRVQARELALAEEPVDSLVAAAERAFGGWLFLAEEAHRRESGGDYTLLHGSARRWPLPPGLVDELLAQPLSWFESERPCLLDVTRKLAALRLDELCWDLAVTSVTLYEIGSYFDDWRQTHERALAVVRRCGNARGEAAVLDSLGSLHLVQHNSEEARALLEPALRLFEQVGDRHGQGLVIRNLAYLDRVSGHFDTAMHRYQAARELLRDSGDLMGEAHVLGGMAQIHLDCGDDSAAEELLVQSLTISEQIGSRRAEAQTRHRLGELLLRRGATEEAAKAFQGSLSLVRESKDVIGEAYALLGLGETLVRQGRYASAERVLQDALHLSGTAAEPMIQAKILLARGHLTRIRSSPQAAIRPLEQALHLFEGLRTPHWQARVLAELGEVYAASGRKQDADRSRKIACMLSATVRPPGGSSGRTPGQTPGRAPRQDGLRTYRRRGGA
jgi:DNA-binding SARP family transcriptional activator